MNTDAKSLALSNCTIVSNSISLGTGGGIFSGSVMNERLTLASVLPADHRLLWEELFVPFLAVAPIDSLEEAIAIANRSEYGLTAGIFSEKESEIRLFFDTIQSGVVYANRRTGATTGAWPGVQSFCGWKGSGSTGKGGCGPYYVQQFLREQSRTRVR